MKQRLTVVAANALASCGIIPEPDLQALDDERMFSAYFASTLNEPSFRAIAVQNPDMALMAKCCLSFGVAIMFIHERDACRVEFEKWTDDRIRKVLLELIKVDAYDRGLQLIGVDPSSPNKRVIDHVLVEIVRAYRLAAKNPFDWNSDDFRTLCRVCFNVGVTFIYGRDHKFADLTEPPTGPAKGLPLDCDWKLMQKYGEIAGRYFRASEDDRGDFVDEFSSLAEDGCTEAYNMCGKIFAGDLEDVGFARECYRRAADAGSAFGHWQYEAFENGIEHSMTAAKLGMPIAMEWISRQFSKDGKPHLALYWHNLSVLCGLKTEKDNVKELVDAVCAKPVAYEGSGFAEMGLTEADFKDVTLGLDGNNFTTDDLVVLAKRGSQLAVLQAADVFEGANRFDEANKLFEEAKSNNVRPLPMILRNLADNYYRGLGGPERREQAKELWLSAAYREESACMYTMSLLMRKNDPAIANYWLVGSYLRGFDQAVAAIKDLGK